MRLFIPELGTQVILTEDWTFDLHFERRNETFGKKMGLTAPHNPKYPDWKGFNWWQADSPPVAVTLPVGTILTVNRIYVRQGNKAFSSVTFSAKIPNPTGKGKPKGMGRFWVKLAAANTIDCDLLESP